MDYRHNDINSFAQVVRAADNLAATSGGSGDNTEQTGQVIDLTSYGYPKSMIAAFPWKAVIASTFTLTLAYVVEDSADNSTWADLVNVSATTVATGSATTTWRGQEERGIDLQTASRYIRCRFTAVLNRGGTDTAQVSAVYVFGGQAALAA